MKEQRSWSYFSYHCYLFYVFLIFISTLIKKIEILKREFFLRKIVEKKNTFALLANKILTKTVAINSVGYLTHLCILFQAVKKLWYFHVFFLKKFSPPEHLKAHNQKMPRLAQKACPTLKQLCIQSICTHIDTLWCKNFLDSYYRTAHWIYILGPFDSLPPPLIQATSRLKILF